MLIKISTMTLSIYMILQNIFMKKMIFLVPVISVLAACSSAPVSQSQIAPINGQKNLPILLSQTAIYRFSLVII
jgi:uncharacterized lipoprotein YajG